YAVLLAAPAYLWLRLPPALAPAKSDAGPEFEKHLEALRKRLARNPRLGELPLASREDVERALTVLSEGSDEVIRDAATRVFLTTAISQSGRLDAILVLSAHTRLVWRVAHLYYQRPTLRDMTYLYANVAATAFMAGELEDIDVSEQIQPVLSAVLGSAVTAVPGFQMASSLLVNSVLTGSANAFLTLRVGMIARRYCATLVVEDRRALRRSATAQAAMMLGGVASYGARTLVKSVAQASKRKLFGGGRPSAADEPLAVAPKRRWFGL
ncbi:MAG: YcjF family protein, partial [Acidobacteriota bacterium]|nr:YcjF family protein [Acidobacteriota bacterium]